MATNGFATYSRNITGPGTRFRFSVQKDIELLNLVILYNPWMYGIKLWDQISNDLKKNKSAVSARAAKDRCNTLITAFKKEELVSMNKGGTEQLYEERATLIAEVVNLKECENHVVTVNVGAHDHDEEINCTQTFNESNHDNSDASSTCDLSSISAKLKKHEKKLAENSLAVAKNTLQSVVDSCITKKEQAILMRVEADAKLKQQEFELKKTQALAEIELRRKQLDLEERRLQLEEKKLTNDNVVQNQILEHQKMILQLLMAKK